MVITYEPNFNSSGIQGFLVVANNGVEDSLPALITVIVTSLESARPDLTLAPESLTAQQDSTWTCPVNVVLGSPGNAESWTVELIDGPDGMTQNVLTWTSVASDSDHVPVRVRITDHSTTPATVDVAHLLLRVVVPVSGGG